MRDFFEKHQTPAQKFNVAARYLSATSVGGEAGSPYPGLTFPMIEHADCIGLTVGFEVQLNVKLSHYFLPWFSLI